jgi:RNA polymerase sigma factor (TIGR02999 family)
LVYNPSDQDPERRCVALRCVATGGEKSHSPGGPRGIGFTMTPPVHPTNVTDWLSRWGAGESDAADEVFRRLYEELRVVARSRLRVYGRSSTLSVTELVNEVYLRLGTDPRLAFEGRSHFLGIAARLVRNVLVDDARRRSSLKRGEGERPLRLEEAELVSIDHHPTLLELEQTLALLERIDPRQAQLVELRVFGGFSMEEAAEYLHVSSATAARLWRKARAWLIAARGAPSTAAVVSPGSSC